MKQVFISYSNKDKIWKKRLEVQLNALKKMNRLKFWDDQQMKPGINWRKEIEKAVNDSVAAIFLVTPNFLASDFIIDKEVPLIFQNQAKNGMKIFPLIVRPCLWKKVEWLEGLNVRLVDGEALSKGSEFEIDAALTAFVGEIDDILGGKPARLSTSIEMPAGPYKTYTHRLPVTDNKLFGRKKAIEILDSAWDDPETRIISFVAWGGVGKTALVNQWLNLMSNDSYRGAKLVYGWSFYSQGTSEDRQVAADDFIAHALRWFGDPDPTAGSLWEKGERLAGLIQQNRTLLILDGMEPLQYPPGEMHGRLKDSGLRIVLRELAKNNPGLCIITTRVPVKDIEDAVGSSVKRVRLENISIEAGSKLLEDLGVKGPDTELRNAVEDFGGHALALNLLGRYLTVVQNGDIRKRDLIPSLAAKEEKGGHAKRIMKSYEKWLSNNPELDILYIMGLFDRPARKEAINVVKAKPAIGGLTSKLHDIDDAKWEYAVMWLRDLGLLAKSDEGQSGESKDVFDCHPIVREYFGERLMKKNPVAWKEAHNRLYEYYKSLPKKKLPDTIEEMEPLFAAIAHGCRARRHQEAFYDVYWERISRKDEFYCVTKLGAFGSELAALSGFFDTPWLAPVSDLSDEVKAFVLNQAGSELQAMGRLREAASPIQAGFVTDINKKGWNNAAIGTSNLSGLWLTLGDINKSIDFAKQGVGFSDQSDEWEQRRARRTDLAFALHQSGEPDKAESLFQEAEAIQKKREPEYPFLYSVQSFRFCDLLLSSGEYFDALKRTAQSIQIAQHYNWLLDIALDNLTFGRAYLLQAKKESTTIFTLAENYLNQAVIDLRKSGQQDYLPYGLLSRAALYHEQHDYKKAQLDLTEAKEIAEPSGMKLHLTDYHLESTRLSLAQNQIVKAKESYKEGLGLGQHMKHCLKCRE